MKTLFFLGMPAYVLIIILAIALIVAGVIIFVKKSNKKPVKRRIDEVYTLVFRAIEDGCEDLIIINLETHENIIKVWGINLKGEGKKPIYEKDIQKIKKIIHMNEKFDEKSVIKNLSKYLEPLGWKYVEKETKIS